MPTMPDISPQNLPGNCYTVRNSGHAVLGSDVSGRMQWIRFYLAGLGAPRLVSLGHFSLGLLKPLQIVLGNL